MQQLASTLGPLAELFSASELDDFASAIDQFGYRCIRPRLGLAELPFETQSVPWTSLGRFLIDSQVRPGSFLQFAAGDYAVQDAASLLPLTLMQLQPGQTVIDCCAAPGGKSAAVLEQLDGSGLLVSNEVIASRIDTLQLTLARTGFSNYMLTHQTVDRLVDAMSQQFDCVLVDAPCSGQSLVGRGKQSLSAFSDHQVNHCAARQQTILESAIQLVRPGGRLVYSTCTFAYAENEAIVNWLHEGLPGWQPVVLEELSPWQTPGHAGCYRLWPHRDHCAGGFAAALHRPDVSNDELATTAASASHYTHTSPSHHTASTRRSLDTWQRITDVSVLEEWSTCSSSALITMGKNQLAMFAESIPDAWRDIAHGGVELATRFGQHWQPAYPAAVLNATARSICQPQRMRSLTDQEALTYFTGTSIHGPGESGWQVVTWRDRPLGWAKQVGTQLKNHLPKPLRQPNLRAG